MNGFYLVQLMYHKSVCQHCKIIRIFTVSICSADCQCPAIRDCEEEIPHSGLVLRNCNLAEMSFGTGQDTGKKHGRRM